MNFKAYIFIPLLTVFISNLNAQDRIAPDYLMVQQLPDSVQNTTLVSLNGTSTTLSEILEQYQGKKILVDFWASWCRDCVASVPKYKEFRKKTKKQKIIYLLLSVDKDNSKWKASIAKFKIKGEHFRFVQGWKNPFSNYVDLDWIPRYLILDEEGKIIQPKSVHIDDDSLIEALTDSK